MVTRGFARRVAASGAFASLALLPVVLSGGPAAKPAAHGPRQIGVKLVGHDTSPAVRSLSTRISTRDRVDPDGANRLIARLRFAGGATRTADPARQSLLFATPRAPIADVTFDGLAGDGALTPPDPNGDVSATQYVQTVNDQFAVYSKTGAVLAGPVSSASFWSGLAGPCSATPEGDPIVLYDQAADRWVVSEFAFASFSGPFYQCVAVSQSGDATGSWYRYSFLTQSSKIPDYPKLGVWSDGYYLAANQFDVLVPGNPTYAGAAVVAFNRSQMLAGAAGGQSLMQYIDTGNPNLGGMLPADLDGSDAPPAGAPNPFLQANDGANQLEVYDFHVDWTTPANTTFALAATIPVSSYDSTLCGGATNCLPQPSPGVALDAVGYDQLMYRLQYRNFTTGTPHESLVVNQTVDVGTNNAAVRWYELTNTGAGWAKVQDGTYAPDGDNRFMGSAAMNGLGEIAVAYSVSGSATKRSLRFGGRAPGDPLGTLPSGEGTLITGQGVQTHDPGRWGDYSSLSVDPADDCTFWYTGEYYPVTADNLWHTRVGSFRLPLCTTGSVAPPANVSLPTISGVAQPGQALTASPGSWSGKQTISFTYQWLRCSPGCDPVGSGGSLYALTPDDIGATIRVSVTAANGILPDATATSDPTATVAGGGSGSTGGSTPDLSVGISALPSTATLGDRITFRIPVTDLNALTAPAENLDVTLPSGLLFVSASSDRGPVCSLAGGSPSGGIVHCALGNFGVGATLAATTIVAQVTGTGALLTTATVSPAPGETILANNTGAVIVTVPVSTASFKDGTVPRVAALASPAHRGRTAKLRFKVWDDSNVAKVSVTVLSRSRVIARLSSGFGKVARGQLYYLPWRAAHGGKPLVFCAVAKDRAGKVSLRSCAPIRIR